MLCNASQYESAFVVILGYKGFCKLACETRSKHDLVQLIFAVLATNFISHDQTCAQMNW